MTVRLFFDTNILVYASDTSEPVKRAQAKSVIDDAVQTGNGVLSVQVLGELFYTVAQRRRLLPAVDAERLIRIYAANFEIASIDHPLVEDAIRLHQRYQLRYWDSLIVATARSCGCKTVLSEDLNDGQDYDGVRASNPFRAASGEGPAPN